MAMFSLEGQSSYNYFAHDLTNHVPMPDPDVSNFAEKQLLKAFNSASSWPVMLGLSDFAGFRQDGSKVPNPNFPWRLIFHPTTKVHNMFPSTGDKPLGEELSILSVGTLFEVYAEPTTGASPIPIGTLDLTSTTTSSLFGDELLFFQHQLMEDDLSYHPEWIAPGRLIMKAQASQPHYTYPDLPWN